METLQIQKTNAITAYNKADEKGKALLVNLFGELALSQKITDRINSFEDVLDITGTDAEEMELREGETEDELAYRQWKIIAKAYNEGVVLDGKNTNQRKYFPWARIDESSGFGLSLTCVVNWYTDTCVGVRLCFKEDAHARDAFKKFTGVYAKMQIG